MTIAPDVNQNVRLSIFSCFFAVLFVTKSFQIITKFAEIEMRQKETLNDFVEFLYYLLANKMF